MSHSVGVLLSEACVAGGPMLYVQERILKFLLERQERAKLGWIKCLAYVLASYSSKLHISGSISDGERFQAKRYGKFSFHKPNISSS